MAQVLPSHVQREGDLGLCCILLCPMQIPREHRGQALLWSRMGSVQGRGWQGCLETYRDRDAFRERTLANCQERLSSTRTACFPFQLCLLPWGGCSDAKVP